MEKIEVNEYIRTKDGEIDKVTLADNECGLYEGTKTTGYLDYEINEIKAHSFNIIDLIEEGDYVNGDKVVKKEKHWLETSYNVIREDHIKSIVTKQQFQAMEYEVK